MKNLFTRRALRKSKLLTQIKEGNGNEKLVFELDMATEDAARNVASNYDRLGFILKHDKELEELCYCRYVAANKRAYN